MQSGTGGRNCGGDRVFSRRCAPFIKEGLLFPGSQLAGPGPEPSVSLEIMLLHLLTPPPGGISWLGVGLLMGGTAPTSKPGRGGQAPPQHAPAQVG